MVRVTYRIKLLLHAIEQNPSFLTVDLSARYSIMYIQQSYIGDDSLNRNVE